MIWLLAHWWMLGVAAFVFGVSIAGLAVLADPPVAEQREWTIARTGERDAP